MPRTITYSLREKAPDSDNFYAAISAFADEWTARTLPGVADLVDGFRTERAGRGLSDRPPASCAFDLLALGVLLREHGGESARLPKWGESLLRGLLEVQERWPTGEAPVKAARGLVHWLARALDGRRTAAGSGLDGLLAWLRATGEDTPAGRLEEWRDYFQSRNSVAESVSRCLCLAGDFTEASLEALGGFTPEVESFLKNEASHSLWRYDSVLLNRTRLEYHLGMMGNEILNRAYRQAFLESPRKIVILPPCMRLQPEEKCKAKATPFGEKCAACMPSCRIHQITKLGEKRGFGVFMIPDELRVFGDGKDSGGALAVVGVSCVLTNWAGGWDAERLGVPAQGVLLDYVGCKYHWDKKGFPTDINLHKLISVLELE